jgi:MFS family permease
MPVTPTAPLEASALRKATQRLIPFLLLLYVVAFIDRVNVGYAKQAFLRDTGLSEAAYAFGAGIFFLGYALLEVPSNLIMHRVGARLWMCRIMVSWGLISAAMMAATTAPTFYALRFFLGAAEAGFFPGVILYLTYWYPASQRGATMGLFYFGAPIAQILGGPLSGWLLEFHGMLGLHGWQWMFVVEGLLASLVGIVVLFYLPNRPADAAWLSAEERCALETAVARERDSAKDGAATSRSRKTATGTSPPHGSTRAGSVASAGSDDHAPLWSILSQPRVLYFCLIYALIQMSVYGVTFYLPSRVAQLLGRQAGFLVGCVSAIPWLCALVAAYAVPRLAGPGRRRAFVGAAALTCGAAGIALSVAGTPLIALLALCLGTAGFIGAQPIFWTFPTSELAGRNAAAGIALINSVGALGGFIAPNLRVFLDAHWAVNGAASYGLALATFLAAVLFTTLRNPRATRADR